MMWENAGTIQKNAIHICRNINPVIKKICGLDEHTKHNFIKQNRGLLLDYGETICCVPQAFQLEKYQKKTGYIADFCQEWRAGNKKPDEFELKNYDRMIDDIAEITDYVISTYNTEPKTCACCGQEVYYLPLSSYYDEQAEKYHVKPHVLETLNRLEYTCPCCGASDRDRLMVSMLKKLGLEENQAKESLLQIAPAKTIEHWINGNCFTLQYDSTDLYMDQVSFVSDISDMNMVEEEVYDYIICSHVLEHVKDDKKAMQELYRILKKDGMGLLMVPIALDVDVIDEEWGLSEAENWRRFGQDDHCRQYSKKGFVERLEESGFYVHQLGREYFGEKLYHENGITDTSILYVVTKEAGTIDEIVQKRRGQRGKHKIGEPLVSVLMSSYNHEAYVGKAIESVLNQTYQNVEFLIADDCSTDHTVDEIMRYEDQIDEIHLFDQNVYGRMPFLNTRAKGKYIAVINSDDMWEADKLQKQVLYMETHPQTAACFTGGQCVDENENGMELELFLQENMKKEAWMHHFFTYGNCLAHPSILIRTEVYQKLLSDEIPAFRQLPDFWMWVKLIQDYDIHVIEKVLIQFRFHESADNANTSARTEENGIRHCYEECYLWYDTMKKMEAEYFKSVFSKELIYKDAEAEEDIWCEKFFILKNANKAYLRQSALFFLFDICQKEGVVAVLKEKYHFQYKDIYELSGK